MTFGRFIESVKSALGLWSFISLVASIALVVGINFSVETVPGWAAAVIGTVTYVLGFLVACYQVAKSEAEGDRDESSISLTDHEDAVERAVAPLREENERLRRAIERIDRQAEMQHLMDVVDDDAESGAEDVAPLPMSSPEEQLAGALDRMGGVDR